MRAGRWRWLSAANDQVVEQAFGPACFLIDTSTHHVAERDYGTGVKLHTGEMPQCVQGRFRGKRRLIDAHTGHGVESVGDGGDARCDWDFAVAQPVWVATAVEGFMVQFYAGDNLIERGPDAHHFGAQHRMHLYQFKF